MFAKLEVDDQLPSPPVTNESPRSFETVASSYPTAAPHLVEDVNDIEGIGTDAGRDGVAHRSDDCDLVGNIIWSFHRSQISTSCGRSWWTEVAGGAELLVLQGKVTKG